MEVDKLTNYSFLRQQFLQAAGEANASLATLPIAVKGPSGESLSIDIAQVGSEDAPHLKVIQSGVHGVEGLALSQWQSEMLQHIKPKQTNERFIWVHGLNPFGMAWWRRVNENNVDLNRNMIDPAEQPYCNDIYRKLNSLLNPASPPSRDGFLVKALWAVMRNGYQSLKQALAEGQNQFPKGLFYAGSEPQPGLNLYSDWLRRQVNHASTVTVIDLHTGLGKFANPTVFWEVGGHKQKADELVTQLAPIKMVLSGVDQMEYQIRGGVKESLRMLIPDKPLNYFTVEFGTYHPLSILYAMREENRLHHHGDAHFDHHLKQALLKAFYPPSERWRESVFRSGRELMESLVRW